MRFRSSTTIAPLSLVAIFMLSGCAQLNNTANSVINNMAHGVNELIGANSDKTSCDDYIAGKVLGTGIGAGIGALAGYAIGGKKGAYLGGAVVGGAGYLLGSAVDERRKELCKIAKETKTTMLLGDIKTKDIDGDIASFEVEADVVALPDVKFKAGSSELTLEQTATLKKFAQVYAKTDKNEKILIVGNTDDSGDVEKNQALSEARAKAIANVFKSQGISDDNLYYQGAGAAMPIASNDTKEGRELNRRVEIAVFKSEDRLVQAVQNRTPNPQFFSKRSSYEKEADSAKTQKNVSEKKVIATHTVKKETKSTTSAQNVASSDLSNKSVQFSEIAHSSDIDFGGDSSKIETLGIKIGSPKKAISWLDSFSFSTPAHASEENWNYRKSCEDDFTKPEYSASSIKKLKDGKVVQYTTGNYYNGLYNTAWIAENVNGHFVSMMPMAILREGAKPVAVPELKVWKNYISNKKDQPDISLSNNVNTYMGDKGLLLRLYPTQKHDSIICSDMFVSADGKTGIQQIYYRKDGKVYVRETQIKKVTQKIKD